MQTDRSAVSFTNAQDTSFATLGTFGESLMAHFFGGGLSFNANKRFGAEFNPLQNVTPAKAGAQVSFFSWCPTAWGLLKNPVPGRCPHLPG